MTDAKAQTCLKKRWNPSDLLNLSDKLLLAGSSLSRSPSPIYSSNALHPSHSYPPLSKNTDHTNDSHITSTTKDHGAIGLDKHIVIPHPPMPTVHSTLHDSPHFKNVTCHHHNALRTHLCKCLVLDNNVGAKSHIIQPDVSDIEIDSEKLFSLTTRFLEKYRIVGPTSSSYLTPNIIGVESFPVTNQNEPFQPIESDMAQIQLHKAFMKFASQCISNGLHFQSSASKNQKPVLTSSRPIDSLLAETKTEPTSGASLTQTGPLPANKINKTPHLPKLNIKNEPSTLPSHTNKQILQKRITAVHEMSLAEADAVRDFLSVTTPFKELRAENARTLADWVLENHGKEPIWNSKAFSVKKYIMLYVKDQSAAERALLQRQRTVKSKVASIKQCAKKLDPTSEIRASTQSIHSFSRRKSNSFGEKKWSDSHQRNVFLMEHPETNQPFKKNGFERTPEDIKILFNAMRGIKAFNDLSDFILGQLCGVIKYQEYETDRAVFKQGDQGTAWYIILSGLCSVQISKTGRIEDSFSVATLGAGSGFGDLALVNDKPRAATILTLSYSELVSVEKTDYNRIIKFIHEKEMKEKIYFLRKVPAFSEWTTSQLRQIGQLIIWRKYAPGTVIHAQGEKFTEFHTIKSGVCHVYQDLHISNTKLKVKVGTLVQLEYFGEEGVMWDEVKGEDEKEHVSYANSTIIAGDEHPSGVEVASITCFDARIRFRNDLTRNPIHDKTSFELFHLYQNDVKQKIWNREKLATMDRIIRERFKDPNMSVSKWKTELARKKKVWKI
ncbi:Rap guanine nucleotide exchange factor-like 1 [Batrachochytrium dendrobatidis]|nr:Rap guanine nucleotide exchange factor-like 1 [Batrachochytrium dendrobatidis]